MFYGTPKKHTKLKKTYKVPDIAMLEKIKTKTKTKVLTGLASGDRVKFVILKWIAAYDQTTRGGSAMPFV